MTFARAWLYALLLSAVGGAHAEQRIELQETEISAARELPKVLYIVPWRQTVPDSRPLPMHSMVDEVLSPVEMDVFKREVRYLELTHPPASSETPTKP